MHGERERERKRFPMIIEVAHMPPEGRRFAGQEPASILNVESTADLHVEGPLSYDLRAKVVSGELIVEGDLMADVSFRCSRCGGLFVLQVREPSLKFVLDLADTGIRGGSRPERNSVGQAGQAESVDLTPNIREAMILAFPNYPLCRFGCKGLCPQCGVNLNEGECDCGPREEVRWSALDDLKIT